ncbi:MAG: type 4a pilus biogenesis protein PilO [Patescibacteria group bacterium]
MSSISILAYVILSLSIGYAFIYSPMGDLTALMDKKQQYNDSLETINNIENTKKELLTKFNNISVEEKKEIDTLLPSSFDFVRLVSQIDAVAANHGISISNISSENLNSPSGDANTEAKTSNSLNSATVGFSFEASYDNFNSFMDDLEKSMRILDIKSMSLSAQKGNIYKYEVKFVTYWLK